MNKVGSSKYSQWLQPSKGWLRQSGISSPTAAQLARTCTCDAAAAFGAASSTLTSRFVGVLAHSIMGVLLVRRARDVDTSSKDSLYSFYMFLWKLFYAEYAVLPFLR